MRFAAFCVVQLMTHFVMTDHIYFARCMTFYFCSRLLADADVCFSYSPQNLLAGMNKFLQSLDITFRRDPNNFRPRINKLNSVKVCTNADY